MGGGNLEWVEKFRVGGANLERVEQIWRRWSKFGVGEASLELLEQVWAEQCGEYLTIWRRRCCVSFNFLGQHFKLYMLVVM